MYTFGIKYTGGEHADQLLSVLKLSCSSQGFYRQEMWWKTPQLGLLLPTGQLVSAVVLYVQEGLFSVAGGGGGAEDC